MEIKELDELIKLLNKLKDGPGMEEFNEDLVIEEFIKFIEVYKKFLHGDKN
jgi:hypothetical protein